MTTSSGTPELVLVEDCKDDEILALRAISKCGVVCRVIVKRDGHEALQYLLHDDGAAPSLIVLDFQMPQFNGLEVLNRLRGHDKTRHVPVVIFSGTNAGEELKECYRVGANSCVSKPVDAMEYLDRLSTMIRYWLTLNVVSDQLLDAA